MTNTSLGSLIQINRSTPFDLATFLDEGWSIAEQDERTLALTEVDLNQVTFETTLRSGETLIKGEEKLKRLIASGKIRLDAKVLQTLWENKALIPESWRLKGYIYFDGTIFRGPGGDRCVLCLFWLVCKWYSGYDWLVGDWNAENPSACLAS